MVTSSLVSTLEGRQHCKQFAPNSFRLSSSFQGQKHANTCGGNFLSALFTHAPALPAKEKPEQG